MNHWRAIRFAYDAFFEHDGFVLASGIAFFAVLSLAPMLVVALGLASVVFEQAVVNGALQRQIEPVVGEKLASFIAQIVERAGPPEAGGVAALVGTLVMFYAATRVFVELEDALRKVWGLSKQEDSRLHVLAFRFFYRRLVAFLLVALLGVLLSALLFAEAALQWLAEQVHLVPTPGALHFADVTLGYVALWVLIAAIYRALTDGVVLWGNALRGAALTTLLMGLGGGLVGLYLRVGFSYSVYGAAGSFAALMLGSYYGAIIFLFGAELAHAYRLLLRD